MIQNIQNFFSTNFQNYIWLAVFILSLLPIFEGRIAILFAINSELLKQNAMPAYLALLTCALAGAFLTLFLLYFFELIINKIHNKKIKNKLKNLAKDKSRKIENKKNSYLYLFLFVLIPLPLTGIYTSSLIASFLKLNKIKSFCAISFGNVFSLTIILLTSYFFKNSAILIYLILFLLTFLIILFSNIIKRKNKRSK